jgi:hypothetical protein
MRKILVKYTQSTLVVASGISLSWYQSVLVYLSPWKFELSTDGSQWHNNKETIVLHSTISHVKGSP